ncbi:hypothetical protein GCM10009843_16490 [Nocardioides bigeumensis]|uniref:Uncharacterized protein n=1 Tax=Nocardioides bigeumensis TaxID=433657 RepID=A0ABN2Y618_9ACTN
MAAGRSAQGWVVVPVAYAAFYLVLRLGGPLALRRTERKNAEVEPLDPGHRGVEVTGRRTEETAQWLVEHCDLPRVSAGGRSRLRVDAATYARVGEVAEQIDTGYTRVNGDVLVVHDLQPAAVRVHALRRRGWWRLLGDDRAEWDITDGDRTGRLVSGKAHLVSGLPVLVCFRFCAVFGGTSRWMIGFPRKPVGGSSTDERQVLTRVFPPLTASPHVVDPVEVLVPLENALVERRRRYLSLLEELAAEPDLSFRDARRAPDLALLTRVAGEVMAGSGERLCDLVDRAKEEHGLQVAIACARALARLPLGEFRSLTQRLLPIVGSRILSLQWTLTPSWTCVRCRGACRASATRADSGCCPGSRTSSRGWASSTILGSSGSSRGWPRRPVGSTR